MTRDPTSSLLTIRRAGVKPVRAAVVVTLIKELVEVLPHRLLRTAITKRKNPRLAVSVF